MQGRRHAGFTLLEMMIVMVILGLAISMVFGGAKNLLPESRLRSAAEDIANRISDVREEAIVRGWTVTFEYDLDRRTYYAWAVAPPGLIDEQLIEEDGRFYFDLGGSQARTELPFNVRFIDLQLGEENPVRSGIVQVTFNAFGLATAHTVHLENLETQQRMTVEVDPLTGLCQILEGYQEVKPIQYENFRG
jgi:prepilin-type N-terminal cleavage/methylation domain-containing protein